MKVISTGFKFDIYPDDLKSYDRLPTDYYAVLRVIYVENTMKLC